MNFIGLEEGLIGEYIIMCGEWLLLFMNGMFSCMYYICSNGNDIF